MKISKTAIEKCKNNHRLNAKLVLEFDVTGRTVEYWFQKNSDKLTRVAALAIIKEETGLTEEQILTNN